MYCLGPGESGKSTIFKQMKIIQDGGGYSREELLEYKYIIFANCISQMKCLVDAGAKLGIDVANPANRVSGHMTFMCTYGVDFCGCDLLCYVLKVVVYDCCGYLFNLRQLPCIC